MNVPYHIELCNVFGATQKATEQETLIKIEPRWPEYEKKLSTLVVIWFDGINPLLLPLKLWEAVKTPKSPATLYAGPWDERS